MPKRKTTLAVIKAKKGKREGNRKRKNGGKTKLKKWAFR